MLARFYMHTAIYVPSRPTCCLHKSPSSFILVCAEQPPYPGGGCVARHMWRRGRSCKRCWALGVSENVASREGLHHNEKNISALINFVLLSADVDYINWCAVRLCCSFLAGTDVDFCGLHCRSAIGRWMRFIAGWRRSRIVLLSSTSSQSFQDVCMNNLSVFAMLDWVRSCCIRWSNVANHGRWSGWK